MSGFFRLIVLIRDCYTIRLSFIKTKRVLIKNDLDTGKIPYTAWEKVELVYNDPRFCPSILFPYFVEEYIDLSFSGVRRTVSELHLCIDTFKKAFNSTMSDYRRSGHNHSDFLDLMEHLG